MDLIYTNSKKEELGIIKDYVFDLAYGSSENNFVLKLPRVQKMLEDGAIVYIEDSTGEVIGTEYGGIIDSITTDTVANEVRYEGRTWHGILANSVIEPDEGYSYYEVDGDANDIIGKLLEKLGLTDFFYVEEVESGITISQYEFDRYTDAYKGLLKMLATANAKMKLRYNSTVKKVEIIAKIISNYSYDEEWDNDLLDFKAKTNYRPVNHLICLGQGDMVDRAVIHLFLDEDNVLQPYSTIENPREQNEYILDKSQQKIFGADEVAQVLDYPNAEIVENYIVLEGIPDNWETNPTAYYYMTEDAKGNIQYNNVAWEVYPYAVLPYPNDWETAYASYYMLNGDKYVHVESVPADEYKRLTNVPPDWGTGYPNYFTYSNGSYVAVKGTDKYNLLNYDTEPPFWKNEYYKYFEIRGDIYVPVESVDSEYKPLKETAPPDWSTNYGNYYYQSATDKYDQVQGIISYSVEKSTTAPDNWKSKYNEYYITNDGVNFVRVSGVPTYSYIPQTNKPDGWENNYTSYFYLDGKKYKSIPESKKEVWATTDKKPDKWKTEYSKYYIIVWDGVKKQYNSVNGVTGYKYEIQDGSKAPSDWAKNYANYYELNKDGKYVKVTGVKKDGKTVAPKWVKNKYYTRYQITKAPNFDTVLNSSYGKKIAYKTTVNNPPKWELGKYYTKIQNGEKAPDWAANKYYSQTISPPVYVFGVFYYLSEAGAPEWKNYTYYEYENTYAPEFYGTNVYYEHITEKAPAWEDGKYYYEHEWQKAPTWQEATFYRKAYDFYKTLVASGVAKLQEYVNADKIEMTNSFYQDYDIGDIVGANDNVTGIEVWQPITKKIVTINQGETSFRYEVGKEA